MPKKSEYERFSYTAVSVAGGVQRLRPILSVVFSTSERRITFPCLVDSGADINVLPYSLGLALGLNWESTPAGPILGGKFLQTETRLIVLPTQIGKSSLVDLVFAWISVDIGPVILGQMNFFKEFNVCFLGSDDAFELARKSD